jgi:murein DD-endopeptidase MepM/ murein hydrolase activator NlpD
MDKPAEKPKRGALARLRSSYRLVLIDDRSFEERFSLRLNRLSVLVGTVITFALYGAVIVAVIVLTPLKRYIPGYSDQETRLNAYRSTLKADSLEGVLAAQSRYIDQLRAVLRGDAPADSAHLFSPASVRPGAEDLRPSAQDSVLRQLVAGEERYSLVEGRGSAERRELAGLLFAAPVKGVITAPFDRGKGHLGVDAVTRADEAVKACLAGSVIFAGWTTDAGYVMQVQHANGLVSFYKHNSALLKKAGDRVKTGEALAIVGSTGENSTGPHLHFELWHNGEPVDPAAYIAFQ